jgi:hypothetical protein
MAVAGEKPMAVDSRLVEASNKRVGTRWDARREATQAELATCGRAVARLRRVPTPFRAVLLGGLGLLLLQAVEVAAETAEIENASVIERPLGNGGRYFGQNEDEFIEPWSPGEILHGALDEGTQESARWIGYVDDRNADPAVSGRDRRSRLRTADLQ